MHDARNLLVDKRNEVSARDKKLALVFCDNSVRGKFGPRGTSAAEFCERVGVYLVDAPAARDKATRRGADIPELVNALAFERLARRRGDGERRDWDYEEPGIPAILRDKPDERTRHVGEDPYFANLHRRIEFRVAARRLARE